MIKQLLENIRRIRKQRGYSQENIAFDLGIEFTTYGKIERGESKLTVVRLEEIAKVLGVKVSDLYPALTNDETIIEGRFKIVKIEDSPLKKNFEVFKASQIEQ